MDPWWKSMTNREATNRLIQSSLLKKVSSCLVWNMGRTCYLRTVRFMVGKGIYVRRDQIRCFRPSNWQSTGPGWFPNAFLSRILGNIKGWPSLFFLRISSKWKDPQRHQLNFLNLTQKDRSLLCSWLSTHKSYFRALQNTCQSIFPRLPRIKTRRPAFPLPLHFGSRCL